MLYTHIEVKRTQECYNELQGDVRRKHEHEGKLNEILNIKKNSECVIQS